MSSSSRFRAAPRSCSSLLACVGQAQEWVVGGRPLRGLVAGAVPALASALAPPAIFLGATRDEVYNILWVLVFGFATINILSLGARRVDPRKSGLHFGEVLAILIVLISIVLLGWEMLYVFHILPIRLSPR
ncbi:MAG: hypothetical protein WCC32_07885 [Terriglobales bacterium]